MDFPKQCCEFGGNILAFDLLVKNGGGGKDQRDYSSCLVLYMLCSVQY